MIRKFVVALVVTLSIGLVLPTTARAADTGPEGQPVVPGVYDPDVYYQGVHVPLSFPYVWLDKGNTWTFGHVDLTLQNDGNLVMYRHGDHSIVYWASGTNDLPVTQLLMQKDGNLVLYSAGWKTAYWTSNTRHKCTNGYTPALSAQSDSNLVVYCVFYDQKKGYQFDPKWSTNTAGK